MKLKPVHVDGLLYVSIAVFGAIIASFTTDEAFKYVNSYIIFRVKSISEIALAAAGALKMFRSTSYKDSLDDKADLVDKQSQTQPQPKKETQNETVEKPITSNPSAGQHLVN